MRHPIFVILLSMLATPLFSQTEATSIYAEFRYVNVPKEKTDLYNLFGLTQYKVYADGQFLKFETYQEIPLQDSNVKGPTLRTSFIKERETNEIYLCVSLDTLSIRMKAGAAERSSFQQTTQAFNSGGKSVRAMGNRQLGIQGYSCIELIVAGKFSDNISAFVTDQIQLAPSIRDFPLFIGSTEKTYGLMLGRDELVKGQILELRAVALEVNQPKNLYAEMATYQLVTQEQGDVMMKSLLTRMMGPSGGGGKN